MDLVYNNILILCIPVFHLNVNERQAEEKELCRHVNKKDRQPCIQPGLQ